MSIQISSHLYKHRISTAQFNITNPFSTHKTQLVIPSRPTITSVKFSTRLSTSRRLSHSLTIMASSDKSSDKKTSVLFVCLGNICRSPSAEAVFQSTVNMESASDRFIIDSCGTGGGSSNWYLPGGFSYHKGDSADSRMMQVAATRGIKLTSRSRPLVPSDLANFDVILGMDASNIAAIKKAAKHWEQQGLVDPGTNYESKIELMTDYLNKKGKFSKYNEVPDPYYGGTKGFELVLDLLEEACQNLYKKLSD